MNDNVRIYHVDEYCEGASHFSFSERKDVVLLYVNEKGKVIEIQEPEHHQLSTSSLKAERQILFSLLRRQNKKGKLNGCVYIYMSALRRNSRQRQYIQM